MLSKEAATPEALDFAAEHLPDASLRDAGVNSNADFKRKKGDKNPNDVKHKKSGDVKHKKGDDAKHKKRDPSPLADIELVRHKKRDPLSLATLDSPSGGDSQRSDSLDIRLEKSRPSFAEIYAAEALPHQQANRR